MAGQKAGSSKRRQSDSKKLKRASCRRRADERHQENDSISQAHHRRNLALIAEGKLVPWQQALLDRARRREAAGLYESWAGAHKDLASAQKPLRDAFLAYIA